MENDYNDLLSRFIESGDHTLDKILLFTAEIDKMTTVLRRTILIDRSRRENDAEHSWHISVMALLFEKYAVERPNVLHAVEMMLVHDLVESLATPQRRSAKNWPPTNSTPCSPPINRPISAPFGRSSTPRRRRTPNTRTASTAFSRSFTTPSRKATHGATTASAQSAHRSPRGWTSSASSCQPSTRGSSNAWTPPSRTAGSMNSPAENGGAQDILNAEWPSRYLMYSSPRREGTVKPPKVGIQQASGLQLEERMKLK